MFSPCSRREPQPYKPTRIADMFTRVCVALDASLGRSDFGLGYGLVQESELDGDLDFIDWWQYLGPRIVKRLGRERLLGTPAFQITEQQGGGIVIILTSDPWSQELSRRRAADYLGITLRPLGGRNPMTGEPIVIPWL